MLLGRTSMVVVVVINGELMEKCIGWPYAAFVLWAIKKC